VIAQSRRRELTAAEVESLRMLNALGARLSPDFSESELRSAYRRLARRYHPDRHPAGDAAADIRWSRLFGEITTHHKHLTRALERTSL
jgi:DnaJ-class molecular chaperone